MQDLSEIKKEKNYYIMENKNVNIEVKKLHTAPEYLELVRRIATKNEKDLQTVEIGKLAVIKKPKKQAEPEPISRLIEKLGSFKHLSADEFKRVFKFKSEETAEFYKIVGVQLPLMSEDTLIHAINFANSQVEIDWAFRARCVAEVYARCPKLLGGRFKTANAGEGRTNITKMLAEKFNTSETNIKLDARIHQTFSTPVKIEIPAESVEVLAELDTNERLVTRSDKNEFFIDFIERSNKEENTVFVRSFIPHPKLTREHYVVAVRLDGHRAITAIEEAIIEAEAKRTYTAADMERKYFPRKEDRARHFRLYRSDLPQTTIKFEVTFDEMDGDIFCSALAKALLIPREGLMKGAASGRVVEQKGFEGFMQIMKKYLESN